MFLFLLLFFPQSWTLGTQAYKTPSNLAGKQTMGVFRARQSDIWVWKPLCDPLKSVWYYPAVESEESMSLVSDHYGSVFNLYRQRTFSVYSIQE